MELINLPRLRNKELQTVGENTLRICHPIPEVKPAVDKVVDALNVFKEGMQKDVALTISKSELDKVRDKLLIGFTTTVKAETYYPHNDGVSKLVASIDNIVNKYNGIARYRYNEETAAIDNMLDELNQVFKDQETLENVKRWIPLIKAANIDFKNAADEFIEDSAKRDSTESASNLAPQLSEDLQNLYTLMFAHAQIGTNQDIISAYQKLEILINTVN